MEFPQVSTKTRGILAAIVAAAGPFIVMSVYLLVSRWPTRWFTDFSDNIAFAIAVAIAPVCISLLPLKIWSRVAIAILVTPALAFSLFFYSLAFVGSVFGDWL